MSNNSTVCHISFNHSAFDDRIYWKELLTLKNAGYRPVHICVGTQNNDFISDEGIRIIEIKRKALSTRPILNKILQFLFQKKGTINDIFEKAKSIEAAIYHLHDLQVTALAKKLQALPHEPQIIYDAHEAYHFLMLENMPHKGIKKLLHFLYVQMAARWELKNASFCNYIITTDGYTLEYFKKKLPQKKSSNVFNYSYFQPGFAVNESEKEYDLIYTGLFAKGRGIEEIILVVNQLKVTIPVKLLLIGVFENGTLKHQVLRQIHELELTEHISVMNFVPFTEIASYYTRAKIGLGLFHNTQKYSTFIPIKLFEYMAFGLPVIFSNHGPSSEIIKKENCGLLVDYTNIKNITESIQSVLTNKDLYATLSENGKKAVREKYNWQLEQNNLLTIYRQLLS